ncbi:hypothetical protein LTR94_028496, partial [Friedmanniomyces endolithicus]
DDSEWKQIDNESPRLRVQTGVPVRVRRAAFGSYFLNVGDARAIRIAPSALAELAETLGLKQVINNRPDHEEPGQPTSEEIQAAAEATGLEYVWAPVSGMPNADAVQRVAQALRRNLNSDANQFPNDVVELQSYFADDGRTGIRATPGAGARPQLWILGSSLFGAQLAAILGLPYAFASHFAPDALNQALAIYRRDFRPSAVLDRPYAMAGFNVFAADTDEEAELLASSQQQAFVALRTGRPGKLPPP